MAIKRAFRAVFQSFLAMGLGAITASLVLNAADVLAGSLMTDSGDRLSRDGIVVEHVLELDERDRADLKSAATMFVWGLSNGVPRAVWAVASQRDRAEFSTAEEAYLSIVNSFPALASARGVSYESLTSVRGIPTVHLYVTDVDDRRWRASISLIFDSDGVPRVVGCDLEPAPGYLI